MKKILFTGGSGGGKTSTIEYIKNYYEYEGYDVFVVNEVPTMLLNNGFNSIRCGRPHFLELVTQVELYLGNLLEQEAEKSSNKDKIILFDKGPIDNLAYIEREELDNMLEKLGTSYDEIINSYDLIIHLETIAKDLPEFYTNDTNKNRTLNKKLAIERNNKILEAYKNSNNRIIIGNYKSLEEKQKVALREIDKILPNY